MRNPLAKKKPPTGRQPVNQAGKPKAAFSYYAADNTSSEKQGKRQRPGVPQGSSWKRRLSTAPTLIAIGAIFAAIVFSTTIAATPKVHFAEGGSPYHSTGEYQAAVQRLVGKSLLNRSKLTVNTSKLEAEMLADFPELDAARFTLPVIGRRPVLTLHVRQPMLILTTRSNALVLDSSGRAVSDVKQLPSSITTKLLTAQDESGLELKVGEQAVTTETVNFIDNVSKQLKDKNLTISKLVLPMAANELDIYLENIAYRIKTDVSGDARLQMGAYLAVKDKLQASGETPSEYVDVRVEEKVFYK